MRTAPVFSGVKYVADDGLTTLTVATGNACSDLHGESHFPERLSTTLTRLAPR